MAYTVNSAFNEFMKEKVNLDPDVVDKARKSRDNLLDNIEEFNNKDGFFHLWKERNFHFGSFARKTKCRELDDIDLMIGISADGATYNNLDPWDDVTMWANRMNFPQMDCMDQDGTLNSIKVVNKFKKQLQHVREYSRSDIYRNHEAVVLNLISKVWSFDIVPCFHTVTEYDGRAYYLIPNGKGNWKKTDPERDKGCVITTNRIQCGRVLELIRLCKKWNKVKRVKTMPSYLLETMIVNHADKALVLDSRLQIRFIDALGYIINNIHFEVHDMKDIQGNINTLNYHERSSIREKAIADREKALLAQEYEECGEYEKAIRKWGEIFGSDFPTYG